MILEPRLYPQKFHRPTTSNAEIKVYDALKQNLPKGWYAWHSLKLRGKKGMEGEGDFVIAIPGKGVVIMEVKGGQISVEDGQWYQNGRLMDFTPRDQAHRFKRILMERLSDMDCYTPIYGIVTAFPDTSFDFPPTQDDLNHVVMGESDLSYVADFLQNISKYMEPDQRIKKTRWIEAIHSLWGETWTPSLKLGSRIKLDEIARLKLDDNQIELLDCIDGNTDQLVEGEAGTGKTVMARETAIRFAKDGKRVLFLCYTTALAEWLKEKINTDNIQVFTVKEFAATLLKQAGLIKIFEDSSEFWNKVSLWAADEALPQIKESWDTVVIDEGQDFTDDDWLLVDECLKEKSLWTFMDSRQAFWPDRALPDRVKSAPKFRLTKSYRCPDVINILADAYANGTISEENAKAVTSQDRIKLIICPSETMIEKKIVLEIDKFLSHGLSPSDIAIISLRGLTSNDSILGKSNLGRHRVVKSDDPNMEANIIADTFLRFKGLERPAIIVTDIRLVTDRLETRMHIALTRALSFVKIVTTKESAVMCPILRKIS